MDDVITPEWLDNNLPLYATSYKQFGATGDLLSAWRKIDGVWQDVTAREKAINDAKKALDKAAKENDSFNRKLNVEKLLSEAIDSYIATARGADDD